MQNVAFLTAEKLQVKRPYIYSNLYYNITPRLFLQFLFCYKIKYANLGLFIWLFYFDIVDTLLQETFTPQKVLVIPRNRWLRLNMTEKLFTGTLNHNQNKTKTLLQFIERNSDHSVSKSMLLII